VVPLPENFVAEANRIKASRVTPTGKAANNNEEGDRNRVRRPKSRRPNFGHAGVPKSNRARRRASGR
jgi:hypothetical protein